MKRYSPSSSLSSSRTSSARPGCAASWGSPPTIASATRRALDEQRHVVRVAQRGQPQVALALLARAQQRALAPQPQVRLGQREAVRRARHRRQALVALLAAEEVTPARRRDRPTRPAQLVQLGDAEAVRALDHHDGGLGHVDADLDHGRGDEHLELAARGSGP